MPKSKKDIHNLFSPRIAEKRKRRQDVNRQRVRDVAENKTELEGPATVDNFRNNNPLFGPHRIKRLEAPVIQRKISPTEGKPTVNGKSGDTVKRLVHKPVPKTTEMDPAAGAIQERSKKKKAGRKPGGK